MMKKLYIEFYDRNNVFRCAVATGETIPAGVIIGKGWTVKTAYREVETCPVCGESEHAGDCE